MDLVMLHTVSLALQADM